MAQPYTYTVRELVYELGLFVNDAMLVHATADSGAATAFKSDDLQGITDNSLAGTELWAWDRPSGDASLNIRLPQVVVTNVGATGVLTLNRAAFGVEYKNGNRVVLQNFNGRGHPQVKKEFALKMAAMELYDVNAAAYQVVATPSTTDFWNAIPVALRSIYRVAGWNDFTGQEFEIAPATWADRIDVAGRRINLPFDWQAGDEVRVYGRSDPTLWWSTLRDVTTGGVSVTAYGASVAGDPRTIIQRAIPWLLPGKRDEKARRDTEFQFARALREAAQRPFPNEVWLE